MTILDARNKNLKPAATSARSHYAGRLPAGSAQPVVLSKNGNRHVRRMPEDGTVENDVISCGLACSECFSGPNLARVLRPGFLYEQKVMEDLSKGIAAEPLSIHTSGGVSESLETFLDALKPHLPWKKNGGDMIDLDDYVVSLQLEGASAVWAAIDMLLQLRNDDKRLVAVGQVSYHGPPSTSFGSKIPLWEKPHQVLYPVPIAGEDFREDEFYVSRFRSFLDEHESKVGVILFEPQWGSSQAALPWKPNLLKTYIRLSKERGISVVCDEIMCGLGRHGLLNSSGSSGCLFASKALDLDPDAVTFGKAIGGGVYPLSGAILKRGRNELHRTGRTVLQSHTYSGSSVRALMTATEVIREIPNWFAVVSKRGKDLERIFSNLEQISNGMLITHGQGMMWGAIFTKKKGGDLQQKVNRDEAIACLRKNCNKFGILPYVVPCGGFMVSPLFDVDDDTIREIGQRLEKVVISTMEDIQWETKTTVTVATKEAQTSSSSMQSSCSGSERSLIPAITEDPPPSPPPPPQPSKIIDHRPDSPRSVTVTTGRLVVS